MPTPAQMLLLFSYAAFTITEAIHLSGIVASLMAGIGMNHYTKRNLTTRGQHVARDAFRMLADVADTIVFFQVWVHTHTHSSALHLAAVSLTHSMCATVCVCVSVCLSVCLWGRWA